jgi:hypothetical protein
VHQRLHGTRSLDKGRAPLVSLTRGRRPILLRSARALPRKELISRVNFAMAVKRSLHHRLAALRAKELLLTGIALRSALISFKELEND